VTHIRPQPTDPLTALTKTSSTSEAHSRWHGRTTDMWENVKAHGAAGDGTTDDTQAIVAAIEACLDGGSVFFPAGNYKVTETIDVSDYTNIHFVGGNIGFRNVETEEGPTGFVNGAFTPAARIDGSTITDGPVFYADRGGSTAIHVWENLMVVAGKTGWHYLESANVKFKNASAQCVADEDGDEDNCAVLIENSFWVWFEGSGYTSPDNTKPSVILRASDPVVNAAGGLVRFANCTFWLGGVEIQVNVDPPSFGNIELHNCLTESAATPVLNITQSGFSDTWNLRVLRVVNCEQADSAVDHAVVTLNAADCTLVAPIIEGCQSSTLRALEVTAGSVRGAVVSGVWGTNGARYVATGSDVSSGASVSMKATGIDIVGDDSSTESTNTFKTHDGALLRHMRPADTHFRFGLSSDGKHQWGSGSATYDANLYRSAADTLKTDDKLVVAGEIELDAALNHDGTTVGFYGVTPTTRPTAYTQTYSTADKTHAAPTAATLTVSDGAGTNDNTIGAITADASVIAAVQEIADEINKLVADVADVKQVVNSIIDDLHSHGVAQ
jgi:hypothetical protein